jgi:hypothetical protein
VLTHLLGPPLCITRLVMRSRLVLQKTKRRRAGDYDPVMSLRMPLELRAKVEKWAAEQDDKPSVSKAICRLVERGLTTGRRIPR